MAAEYIDQHLIKWEGKATAKLHNSTPEEVWPLIEDFCTIHKWLPTIDTSYKLDGTEGRPGLLRYCAATLSSDGGDSVVKWCHEKLVAIDPTNKWLSYEVLDNNMGFKSYKSTMSIEGTEDDHVHGCVIQWSFVADPIEGLSYKELVAYLDFSLQGMAQNLEKALMESYSTAS